MHFKGWRRASTKVKFWMVLDELIHAIPGIGNRRVAQRICDRFDLSLGVTPDELHRSYVSPLWAKDWDSQEDAVYDRPQADIVIERTPLLSNVGATTFTLGTVTNVTWRSS